MSLSIFLDLAISYTSMYSVYFTLEKENALINHFFRGVSCTFGKSKKLWILHIKKTQCSKVFFVFLAFEHVWENYVF